MGWREEGLADPIVVDELALLDRVNDGIARAPERVPPSEDAIIEELEHVREQLLRGRIDDFERAALNQRWNVLTALLEQLGESRAAPEVDPTSPYFAHLRLRENGRERDLCLGRATCIDDGVRIVDWRHAPVSKIFYRYQQGDEYEEEFGGRRALGRGGGAPQRADPRRRARPDRGARGVLPRRRRRGWRAACAASARASRAARAARCARTREDEAARGGSAPISPATARRADKRLPEITGLIDPAQFDADHARGRLSRDPRQRRLRQDHGGAAPDRLPRLRRSGDRLRRARCSSCSRRRCATTSARAAVARRLGRCGSSPTATGRTSSAGAIFPDLPAAHARRHARVVQRLKLDPALLEALARHVAEHPGPRTRGKALDDWASVLTRPALLRECAPSAHAGRLSRGGVRAVRRLLPAPQRGALRVARGRRGTSRPSSTPRTTRCCCARGSCASARCPAASGRSATATSRSTRCRTSPPLEVRVLIDCLDERRSLTLAGDTQQHVQPHTGFTSWSRFSRGARRGGRRARDAARELPLVAGDRDVRARPARRPARGGGAAACHALGSARRAVPLHRPRRVRARSSPTRCASSRAASRSRRWRC